MSDPTSKTTIRASRVRLIKWLIVVAAGIFGCIAFGSLGLALPLLFCVLWLAEVGELS